jgi:hypothetical protein
LGTEGGQKLHWDGKVGMVFAATQSYDDHTSVNAGLGERNLLVRLGNGHAGAQFHMALRHTGGTAKTMREELAEAVRVLFELPIGPAPPLSDSETKHLESIVTKIVRLRATVVRDWRTREIEAVHAPEGPGRITIALAQLRAGLCGIGLDREIALDVIEKVAFDTAPPSRVEAFSFLSPNKITTREMALKMKLPTNTVRRVLEDLMCQGLVERHRDTDQFGEEKQGGADHWTIQYPDWPLTRNIHIRDRARTPSSIRRVRRGPAPSLIPQMFPEEMGQFPQKKLEEWLSFQLWEKHRACCASDPHARSERRSREGSGTTDFPKELATSKGHPKE